MIASPDNPAVPRANCVTAEMQLDQMLARAGFSTDLVRKQYEPWSWTRQKRLYWSLGYYPSLGQRLAHQSPARTKVVCAGSRFGKSLFAGREALPVVLTPDTNTWICGPTYDLAEKEWRYLTTDLQRLGFLDMAVRYREASPAYLEFPWGSRVWQKSADRPSSLLGEELDLVILSESAQLSKRVFNRYIRARMGSRLGRTLIPTTPFGFSWIRDKWLLGKRQSAQRNLFPENGGHTESIEWRESVESWQFSVLENPYFDAAEYFAARNEMPDEEFAEQWDGRFRELSGRVLPQFRRARHVVEEIPARLHDETILRTIDFGYEAPSVCLWVVWDQYGDPEDGVKPGTFWIVAEIYQKRLLTQDLAKLIKNHSWSRGHRIFATLGDMADAQARAQLGAFGIPVAADATRWAMGSHDPYTLNSGTRDMVSAKVPIDKAVSAGLSTLRTLFHQDRILVHSSCVNLIEEMVRYTFAEDQDVPAPGQADHAIDSLRYLLHTIAPVGVAAT